MATISAFTDKSVNELSAIGAGLVICVSAFGFRPRRLSADFH
jgi:hypothetical protein